MNRRITFAAAAVAVVFSALFAKDSGTTVAGPITNMLFDFHATTNYAISHTVLSMDGAVDQLRSQGDITNLVKKLVAAGDVCAVIGHKWEYGCGMPGCLVIHNDPIRHCVVCGATQTQKVGEWK